MLDQKGRELGRLIGQSSEYQALKRSNESLSEDQEAVKLLRRMEELRGTAQAMIDNGGNPTDVDSWHMFDESGKLLVPYMRPNS